MIRWGLYGLGALAIAVLIFAQPQEAEGVQDSLEFGVWAQCEPHSQASVPQQVNVTISFGSTASSPTAIATMASFSDRKHEARSTTPLWNTPQKTWVAFLFEGPPITGNYYCQADWGPRRVHLSYAPHPKLRIFLSMDGNPSPTEIDPTLQGNRSILTIPPTPGSNTYSAGADSLTPYWLEIALLIRDTQSASTIMYNEFL